jgi:small multidrug resistance pump
MLPHFVWFNRYFGPGIGRVKPDGYGQRGNRIRVSTMALTYLYLTVAIAFEVFATTMLKDTGGFTRLRPSLLTIAGYALAFYFLSLTLRVMPVGVVYAIWSGAGILFITVIGWVYFRQMLDLPAVIGMAFILTGVLIINLFSSTVGH